MNSEIKAVWLFVFFDVPTVTKQDKKNYVAFRKYLLGEGFLMLQFSVYAKYFNCVENTFRYMEGIKALTPEKGEVRILKVTDKQFGDMVSLIGSEPVPVEDHLEQLLLF